MFFIGFPITSYPFTSCDKHWIFQTACKGRSIKFIIIFIQISQYLIWVKHTIKNLSLQKPLPFQSQTTQSTITQSSIQSVLNSLQNDRYFFISYHSTCSFNHSNNPHQQFVPLYQPIFTSIFHLPAYSQNHPYNPFNTFFLNNSTILCVYFTYSHLYNSHQKSFLIH